MQMIHQFEKRPEVQRKIKVTVDIVDRVSLQKMYKCADVLLVSSKSEGFCLPLLEAQAQGTAAVTTGFMAMADWCKNGVAVPYDQLSYNGFENCWWAQPSVPHLTNGLIQVWKRDAQTREQQRDLGIQMVKQQMSYSVVYEQFKPIFKQMLELDAKRKAKQQLLLQEQQQAQQQAGTNKFSQVPIIINGPPLPVVSSPPVPINNNSSIPKVVTLPYQPPMNHSSSPPPPPPIAQTVSPTVPPKTGGLLSSRINRGLQPIPLQPNRPPQQQDSLLF
jgi:hypothetical protein